MLHVASVGGAQKRRLSDVSAAARAAAAEQNVDRACLRGEYETALRAQASGLHGEADSQFDALLKSLPREEQAEATGPERPGTSRDTHWLRGFRGLCLHNRAVSLQALGRHDAAVECWRLALCARGGYSESADCDALWRGVVDSALAAEDWGAAKLGLERRLQHWPADAALLRGLARAALGIGDFRLCAQVLGELRAACGGRLPSRDAWLQRRLHWRLGAEGAMDDAPPEAEAELEERFAAAGAERCKRLRAAADARAWMGCKGSRLARASLGELLAAAHQIAKGRAPPSLRVVFEVVGEDDRPSQVDLAATPRGGARSDAAAPAAALPRSSEAHPAARAAVWERLRPLVVSPWASSEAAPAWALATVERRSGPGLGRSSSSLGLGTTAAEEEVEETQAVASLLRLRPRPGAAADALGAEGTATPSDAAAPAADAVAARVSEELPWRAWLAKILDFALSRLDMLRSQRGAQRQLGRLGELATALMLLCGPGRRSKHADALRAPWATPALSAWLAQEPEDAEVAEGESSPRRAVRDLLRARGLDIAEVCAAASSPAQPGGAGADFVRVWLQVATPMPPAVSAWLLRCLARPHVGPGSPAQVLEALEAGDLGRPSAEALLRCLWAMASFCDSAAWAASAAELCRALAASGVLGHTPVRTALGDSITTARCAARLAAAGAQVAAAGGGAAAAGGVVDVEEVVADAALPLRDFRDLAQRVLSMWLPRPSEAFAASDAAALRKLLRAAERLPDALAARASAAPAPARGPRRLRSKSTVSAPSPSDEDVPAAEERALDMQNAGAVLEALTWLLCQFVAGLGCCTPADAVAVRDDHGDLLVEALLRVAHLLAALEQRVVALAAKAEAQPVAGSQWPPSGAAPATPLLRGILVPMAGGEHVGVFLAPLLERLFLAVITLGTDVGLAGATAPSAEAAAGIGSSVRWLPVQHAAMCLAVRVLGLLLLGPAVALLGHRGLLEPDGAAGLLLAQRPAASAAQTLSAAQLGTAMCSLVGAAHDLVLQLPEQYYLARRASPSSRAGAAAASAWAARLFGAPRKHGDFDAKLTASTQAPLSMPHVMMSCALRMQCGAIEAWRQDMAAWLEAVSDGGASQTPASQGVASTSAAGGTDLEILTDTGAAVEADSGGAAGGDPRSSLPWRRSMRALRGADGQAPLLGCGSLEAGSDASKAQEGEMAVCGLMVRGLTGIVGIDFIHPSPLPWLRGRGGPMCRLLGDGALAYRTAETKAAEVAAAADVAEDDVRGLLVALQATAKDQSSAARAMGHSPPPHVLALALATHRSLLAVVDADPISSQTPLPQLRVELCRALDLQLFNLGGPSNAPMLVDGATAAPAPAPPQALFHPLLVPRCVLQLIKDNCFFGQDTFRPHLRYAQALLANQGGAGGYAGFLGGYPAGSLAGSHDALVSAKEVEGARDALHRFEWPLALQAGGAPRGGDLDGAAHDDQQARALLASIQAMPSSPSPVGLCDAFAWALAYIPLKRARIQDLLEILVVACKDVAMQPDRWETWSTAACAFKRLFFYQESKVAGEESWREKVSAWTKGKPIAVEWSGRLKWLWGQARALNSAMRLHYEDALAEELGGIVQADSDLAAPNTQDEGDRRRGRCEHVARHWLAKQLDLITLLRCRLQGLSFASPRSVALHGGGPGRKQPPATAAARVGETDGALAERRLWLVQRCDHLARELLWFLVHCTDLGEGLATAAEVLGKHSGTWPFPRFAPAWLASEPLPPPQGQAARPPLLRLRLLNGGALPHILWYLPYLVGCLQWQLSAAGAAQLSNAEILSLLRCATDAEQSIRREAHRMQKQRQAQQQQPQAQQPAQRQFEPFWRLHHTRLKMNREMPEGRWKECATPCCFAVPTTRAQLNQDVFAGLGKLSETDSRYRPRFAFAQARHAAVEGDLPGAVAEVIKMFSFPKDFPKVGRGKVGLIAYRTEEEHRLDENPHLDPYVQFSIRHRNFDIARAKVMFFILDLHRQILAKAVPAAAIAATPWETPDLIAQPQVQAQPQEPRSDKDAAHALRRHGEATPKALHAVVALLLALVRGLPRPVAGNNFWTAFYEALHHALRQAFAALARAATGATPASGSGEARPLFDWTLLSALRAYWTHLEGDARELFEVRAAVGVCYATAAEQLRVYVRAPMPPSMAQPLSKTSGSKQRQKRGVEAAEAFFQAMAPHVPRVAGLWGASDEPPAPPVAGIAPAASTAAAAGPETAAVASGGDGAPGPRGAGGAGAGPLDILLVDSDPEI